jgi:hypothetical protein
VHVPEILEPSFGIHNCEIDVQIPVALLGTFDERDEVFDGFFKFFGVRGRGGRIGEEVGCCFDPASKVSAGV